MNQFELLLQNKILISAVTGWFVAQILKTLIHLYLTKSFVAERLVGSGGMPSSHTATVISLSTCIGALEGFDSTMFAVAGVFAFITMFDAFMVRLPVEKLTEAFNVVREAVLGKDIKALKKVGGHTIPEIIGGFITGAGIALLFLNYSPLFPEYVSIFQQFAK